jgi:hypothetical protein
MKIYTVSARRLSDGHTITKEPIQTSNDLNEAIQLATDFALEMQAAEGTGWVFNLWEEEVNS